MNLGSDDLFPPSRARSAPPGVTEPFAVLNANKRSVTRAPELGLTAGLRMEQLVNRILLGSSDATEGALAFVEKRPARFVGA